MYRVWGGVADQVGAWLTPTMPTSADAVTAELSLPPSNLATYVSEVNVPAGTQFQMGVAGPGFGQAGGGLQVQLLERIPISSFGPGIPLGE
jgi:hypothetical protein